MTENKIDKVSFLTSNAKVQKTVVAKLYSQKLEYFLILDENYIKT